MDMGMGWGIGTSVFMLYRIFESDHMSWFTYVYHLSFSFYLPFKLSKLNVNFKSSSGVSERLK